MLSQRYWDVEEIALCAKGLGGKDAARAVRRALRRAHTEDRPIDPQELGAALRGAGLGCSVQVYPEGGVPPELMEQSAAGRVVLVRLALPVVAGGMSWWCLDCCDNHPSCALRLGYTCVRVADWPTVEAWWDGHAVITDAAVAGAEGGDWELL